MSIGLSDKIAPLGGFAITEDTDTQGGFRVVADATERNAITTSRRKAGMLVYSNAETGFYRLKTGPWVGTNADWNAAILEGLLVSHSSYTGGAPVVAQYLAFSGDSLTMSSLGAGFYSLVLNPKIGFYNDAGSLVARQPSVQFTGAGVTVTNDSGNNRVIVDLDIPGGLAIKDEDSPLVAAATTLNFLGDLVTVNDAGGGQVDITVAQAIEDTYSFTGALEVIVAPGTPTTINVPGVEIQDEGVYVWGGVSVLNFIGPGVTAANGAAGTVDVTISGGGLEIQSEGSSVATEPALNLRGASLEVTDDVPNDRVNVTVWAKEPDPGFANAYYQGLNRVLDGPGDVFNAVPMLEPGIPWSIEPDTGRTDLVGAEEGFWISNSNYGSIVRYVPDNGDQFTLVNLDSAYWAPGAIGRDMINDQANKKLYVFDNGDLGSRLWVIDTRPAEPILSAVSEPSSSYGVMGRPVVFKLDPDVYPDWDFQGMAFDGTDLWIVTGGTDIYRVSPTTGVVTAFAIAGATSLDYIAFDNGYVWASDASSIYKISTAGSLATTYSWPLKSGSPTVGAIFTAGVPGENVLYCKATDGSFNEGMYVFSTATGTFNLSGTGAFWPAPWTGTASGGVTRAMYPDVTMAGGSDQAVWVILQTNAGVWKLTRWKASGTTWGTLASPNKNFLIPSTTYPYSCNNATAIGHSQDGGSLFVLNHSKANMPIGNAESESGFTYGTWLPMTQVIRENALAPLDADGIIPDEYFLVEPQLVYDLLNGVQSTTITTSTPVVVGAAYFSPYADAPFSLGKTRHVQLEVILESSTASYDAQIDLYDVNTIRSGGAEPGVISGSVITTGSLTAVRLTADLSTPLGTTTTPGIIEIRLGIEAPGPGTATCKMARLKVWWD